MKNKLIELLCKIECKGEECFGNCPHRYGQRCNKIQRLEMCAIFKIAEYLLENDVIVPPCNTGDMIYMPWEYKEQIGVACLKVLAFHKTINNDWEIRTHFETDDEGFAEKYNCGVFHFTDIGKTVFLSLKEAHEEGRKRFTERNKQK